MNKVNLDGLSIEQLNIIKNDAQALIELRKKESLKTAYVQFQQIAQSLGVSVKDVVRVGKSIKSKRPAKYRNISNPSQTWSGFGPRPKWLKDAIDQGRSLKEFEVL